MGKGKIVKGIVLFITTGVLGGIGSNLKWPDMSLNGNLISKICGMIGCLVVGAAVTTQGKKYAGNVYDEMVTKSNHLS
jgi:hypothetical protein